MLDSYPDPSKLNGVQGVGGSNPLAPTKIIKRFASVKSLFMCN